MAAISIQTALKVEQLVLDVPHLHPHCPVDNNRNVPQNERCGWVISEIVCNIPHWKERALVSSLDLLAEEAQH